MKHGPIALINEDMPVVVMAVHDHLYDKVISNIEEVRSRGGRVIAVASEGDAHISTWRKKFCTCRRCPKCLQPLVT